MMSNIPLFFRYIASEEFMSREKRKLLSRRIYCSLGAGALVMMIFFVLMDDLELSLISAGITSLATILTIGKPSSFYYRGSDSESSIYSLSISNTCNPASPHYHLNR